MYYEIIERGETLDYDRYGRLVDMYEFKYHVPELGTFTVKIAKDEFTAKKLDELIRIHIRELQATVGKKEV